MFSSWPKIITFKSGAGLFWEGELFLELEEEIEFDEAN